MNQAQPPVTLSTCAQEPIHIPGLIQPHGALLALDDEGLVSHASANLAEVFGASAPRLGEPLAAHHFDADATVHHVLRQAAGMPAIDEPPAPLHARVTLQGQVYDLLAHRLGSAAIAEFERLPHDDLATLDYGPQLHGLTQRLRQQRGVVGILEEAVRTVRAMTGFDRVMAYRFRADDSGEVVAELARPDLPAYLGQRFPESDIPAQARRLYTVNLMRLIADVDRAPVPLLARAEADGPLDLSHAVLRSVSPIHIEYLRNIGVGGSMSLSIVLEGRLWAMLACHHTSARQVPYSVRSACAVLVELVAAHIQAQLAADRAAEVRAHERLRSRLLDRIQYAPNPTAVLADETEAIAAAFGADAVVLSNHSILHSHGDVSPAQRAALVRWLHGGGMTGEKPLVTASIAALAPHLSDVLDGWAGLLAIRYDQVTPATLLLLRREQIETVRWGHTPQKAVTIGPSGPRLTPPGSFELWCETVRGSAETWGEIEVEAISLLGADLRRLLTARLAEMRRYRQTVAAILAQDEQRRAEPASIDGDDGRTKALLQQVLDLTVLRQGQLVLNAGAVDLSRLLAEQVQQAQRRHLGASVFLDLPGGRATPHPMPIQGDAARLAQLFEALLDNAIQNAVPGESVVVRLAARDGMALADVSNVSAPIAPEIVRELFSATSSAREESLTGLGVGLYISQAIARAHGGDIAYAYDEPFVTMTVRLPLGV